MTKPTLLVDFDGVLHDYQGWTGPVPVGQPIEKARAAMHLLANTYRLVCFTTRATDFTKAWLAQYGFPEMKVTDKKEPAVLIIDDRAITFTGVWTDEFIQTINAFQPHWKSRSDPQPG